MESKSYFPPIQISHHNVLLKKRLQSVSEFSSSTIIFLYFFYLPVTNEVLIFSFYFFLLYYHNFKEKEKMELVFKTFTSNVFGSGFLSKWACPWIESEKDQDKKDSISHKSDVKNKIGRQKTKSTIWIMFSQRKIVFRITFTVNFRVSFSATVWCDIKLLTDFKWVLSLQCMTLN